MAKIVFFINTLNNSGGTERISLRIAEEFLHHGHEVFFISWVGGNRSFFQFDDRIKHLYLYNSDKINIYTKYFQSLIKYRKILNNISPDIVIDVCTAMSLLTCPALFFKRKTEFISWEHFNTSVNWNPVTSRLSRWLASRFAKHIVVLTERDKTNYEVIYKAKNVTIIKNPISFKVSFDNSIRMRHKIVLAIGRLTHQKGFDVLLEVWKNINKVREGWILKIVGDGEERENLQNKINNLDLKDTVSLEGSTTNVSKYFEEASLYLMTSRFEGLPLVLIEAKAFGLPIVAFDCETGPREIIKNNIDGYLIKNGFSNEFENKVIKLLDDPLHREAMSKSAIVDSENFKVNSIIDKWLLLI